MTHLAARRGLVPQKGRGDLRPGRPRSSQPARTGPLQMGVAVGEFLTHPQPSVLRGFHKPRTPHTLFIPYAPWSHLPFPTPRFSAWLLEPGQPHWKRARPFSTFPANMAGQWPGGSRARESAARSRGGRDGAPGGPRGRDPDSGPSLTLHSHGPRPASSSRGPWRPTAPACRCPHRGPHAHLHGKGNPRLPDGHP